MTTTTNTLEARLASLCQITGGHPDWYGTRAHLTAAEKRAGVQWNGTTGQHQPARPGKLVKAKTGSWGREIGGGKVAALTLAECESLKLIPGPANF